MSEEIGTEVSGETTGENVETSEAAAPSTMIQALGTVEVPAEGEAPKEEAKAEGAPEAYSDFVEPEGIKFVPAVTEAYKTLAKDFNLSQEQAQGLMDRYAAEIMPKIAETQMAEWNRNIQERQTAIRSDKEIGGDNLALTNSTVNRVVNTYLNAEEAKSLSEYFGTFGDHPAVIKLLTRVGKSIGEDKIITADSKGDTERTEADRHKAMYPTMYK